MMTQTKHRIGRQMTWATTAAMAAAGSADAELVQINLIGNQVTASGGDQLFADLDGDGTGDVTFSPFVAPGGPLPLYWSNGTIAPSYLFNGALVRIDGGLGTSLASARNFGYTTGGFSAVYTQGPGTGPAGLMPINLSGVAGNAWLEVQRRVEEAASPTVGDPLAGVYLTRVIYDTDPEGTAVPDVEAEYDVVATVDDNGIVTTAAGPKVTAFSVSGGTATITIKGKPDTSYTVKTSTTLSGFTAITPTSGSATTDGNGDATFAVDAIGPKRFYVVGE